MLQWKDDPKGLSIRDVGYVVDAMAEIEASFAALKAKEPSWRRIDEYAQRIAFLKIAAASHAKHYQNVATAKDSAVAAADAQAQVDWLAKRVTDEGVTGDVHKRSVGKILFAKAALAGSGAGATDEVEVGDPLFVRAYFPESPWNFLHTGGIDCSPRGRTVDDVYWVRTWAHINGGDPIELETMTLDRAAMQTKTTSTLTEGGSLTKGGAYGNSDEKLMPFRWLTRVAAKLEPGSNKVKLESFVWCAGATYAGKSIASGEVTIRATAAQLAEVGRRGTFKLTASTHPKAKLARWQTAMTKHYGGKWDLLDLRTAGEWELRRDEKTSVVLSRDAPAVVVLRNKADAYCELVSVVLSEPFDGRTYGPQVEWGFEMPRPFVCNVQ